MEGKYWTKKQKGPEQSVLGADLHIELITFRLERLTWNEVDKDNTVDTREDLLMVGMETPSNAHSVPWGEACAYGRAQVTASK